MCSTTIIEWPLSINELNEISKFLTKDGETLVNIKLPKDEKKVKFQLENKRNLDRKTLNLIRNKEISAIIN